MQSQVAMVFRDERGLYSVWFPDGMLTDPRFEALMIEYETDGCSVAGTAEQISEEIFGERK